MKKFLNRLSSRKFMTAFAVEAAAVAALFAPAGQAGEIESAAVKIASLIVMLATALGYIFIEGKIDANPDVKREEGSK